MRDSDHANKRSLCHDSPIPIEGQRTHRAARSFASALYPPGRFGGARRALSKAIDIWLTEGLVSLAGRTVSRLGRDIGRRLGISEEGRRLWATARREKLLEAIAAEEQRRGAQIAPRGLTEINHVLNRDCQHCSHFHRSSCDLATGSRLDERRKNFHAMLLDRGATCPAGIWPGRESPPITRFNLVYFIFPLRHPEQVWQWNVAELLERLELFNGRRIVSIATVPGGVLPNGRRVDPPEEVVKAFVGHDVEFRFVENDPQRQEAPHFLSALREVASVDPGEVVFYAHAKGVTRPRQGGEAIRAWTSAMYAHNLDRIEEVADLLRRWPCVGIAKQYGYPEIFAEKRAHRGWGEGNRAWHGWHYAGSFWWARHDALFSRSDWDQFELFAYATEKYLANFFRADEAYCLAYDECNLPYELATWQTSGTLQRPVPVTAPTPRRKAA